ncbi:hypothetical protein [Halorussus amylolyticus]|uniref:hypothetical protein n=1 Tax=Halorussus amylolyticus TaxID=1126242 RepID=UPI0010441AC1|nr:hypothetical protein [Halorussus amylolyticus]
MNWQDAERAAWTLGLGGFLAILFGALVAPNPTAFWPYAAVSLLVGLPIARWYVNQKTASHDGAGRLTLFFLALFGVSLVGFWTVERVVAPETALDLAGRVVTVLVALRVARRASGDGYDRLRAALGTPSASR